jgi:hypothetical protein
MSLFFTRVESPERLDGQQDSLCHYAFRRLHVSDTCRRIWASFNRIVAVIIRWLGGAEYCVGDETVFKRPFLLGARASSSCLHFCALDYII